MGKKKKTRKEISQMRGTEKDMIFSGRCLKRIEGAEDGGSFGVVVSRFAEFD